MTEEVWPWLGNVHDVVAGHWPGIICTVSAVICGAVIGIERERAQKPAGLRTMILICLGSAIFAQASILLAGEGGDRSRIAAQVVSGIGFLGAGAIIQARGQLIGVTTGASVWATAAVGVVLGGGYVAAGGFFTALIVGTLAAAKVLDRVVAGNCHHTNLVIRYDPDNGKTRIAIQAVLDQHQRDEVIQFTEPSAGMAEARLRFCHVHREHRSFLAALPEIRAIHEIRQG